MVDAAVETRKNLFVFETENKKNKKKNQLHVYFPELTN